MNGETADTRAHDLVRQMTLDEKIQLVTGYIGMPIPDDPALLAQPPFSMMPKEMLPPPGGIGTDGYVPGIERLGIPAINLCGAGAGLTNLFGRADGEAVAFPAAIAQAATWNPKLKAAFGYRYGLEARYHGINVALAAAANLVVEPRSGRVFEYHGEDPVLSGYMVAEELRGTQDAGIVASVKHYAANFQETGRFIVNTVMDETALRESELLSFELAITRSDVAAVMTSYNLLNGTYASESEFLLSTVLRKNWGFDGWVLSDWGAAHSTAPSAMAGLDQEFPLARWFGQSLKNAVEGGDVPIARLDEMNFRILRKLALFDLLDPVPLQFDVQESLDVAERIAEESLVLLQNDNSLLPLVDPKSILIVGKHADVGMPAGGGSGAVTPIGGGAATGEPVALMTAQWVPSSPLEAVRAEFPSANVTWLAGSDSAAVREAADGVDVVIVFAHQVTSEGADVPSLELPDGQSEVIRELGAGAAPVVVVLTTGGPVSTDWSSAVSAIVEAWYPGQRGASAIAGLLSGRINPSGKLPVSFPAHESDLPYSVFRDPADAGIGTSMDIVNVDTEPASRFDATYGHGEHFGYKWLTGDRSAAFPFGFGLSFTSFDFANFAVMEDNGRVTATAEIANTGDRAGAEVVQVYAALPASVDRPRRLVGWTKVSLQPGERLSIRVPLESRALSIWNGEQSAWQIPAGQFEFTLGASSQHVASTVRLELSDDGVA